ncbi:hypothetical protein [Kaistia terrae]|uniref:Uncharacterized protein n=1 Tax=Kaistia terrae TaxID=537017 RepID=A0ABW0Q8V0_9HYPH|nr:hypothetical protein [Kaistia terrae]MCX5581274.1 hypothetical protein [Kaistia terrae]
MTLANDVPSDLPRFFSFFRAADPKVARDSEPSQRPDQVLDGDKADDADTTSDLVWSLAYWPWL